MPTERGNVPEYFGILEKNVRESKVICWISAIGENEKMIKMMVIFERQLINRSKYLHIFAILGIKADNMEGIIIIAVKGILKSRNI